MSFTHVTKSGKTVTTGDGFTKITKLKDGKYVTKTYNMNNLTAGTVIGNAEHVTIGQGKVRVGSIPPRLGPMGSGMPRVPSGHPAHTRGRRVNNQFNITSSVIGQVAIGNKGPTVFNNETRNFKAGSVNTDFDISGGNFSQANIGGQGAYHNDKASINAGGNGESGQGMSIDDLLNSDMVAEDKVSNILSHEISSDEFIALLRKGFTIEKIEQAMVKGPAKLMIKSMLSHDGTQDSDSD